MSHEPPGPRLVLTLFAALLIAGCAGRTDETTSTMRRVRRAGVMKVGFEGGYPPFNFLNEQKQFDGFLRELAACGVQVSQITSGR